MAIEVAQRSIEHNMPSESPDKKVKRIIKKGSLKRRLSGIFLLDNEPKPLAIESAVETSKLDIPLEASISPEVKAMPSKSFFSFPSYLKKSKTRTVPNTAIETVESKEPIITNEADIQERLDAETLAENAASGVSTPQLAYKISLQKLHESSRRPLIQVLLIHQTMTEVTSKLRKQGIHPMQLMHEQRLAHIRGLSASTPRPRTYPIRRRSPPPPYSPTSDSVPDHEDDVPLGLLQKEFLKPATVSVLVA